MIAARSRALPTCSSWLQAILPRALSAVPETLQSVAVPTSNNTASQRSVPTQSASQHKYSSEQQQHAWIAPIAAAKVDLTRPGAWPVPQSVWSHMLELQSHQMRHMGTALSRVRVPKAVGINDTVMPNTTTLKYGQYGIRALTSKRVAANTIEAVRRTLRRRLKKTAALWVRIEATVPVTRKPEGIRMGKGKGAIEFYACPVRHGQIIFEMDRVPRKVALSALEAIQPKFPCQLGFVEWN